MEFTSYQLDQFISLLMVLGWHFYSNFHRTFCKQTEETLIRHHNLQHLIWVCTVCLCPTICTLGFCGLSESESLYCPDASHKISVQSDTGSGDVIGRISSWLQYTVLEWKSDCSGTSHQVLAQSDIWFWWRCCLKNFKMAAIVSILNNEKKYFLAFLNLHVALCLT